MLCPVARPDKNPASARAEHPVGRKPSMTTLSGKPVEVIPHGKGLMRALYKHHAGEGLAFDDQRAIPEPGPRDVLIRVSKVGICGTDRHIWEWDQWAASRIPVGIVTGHEFVGVVERVGSAVTRFEAGQRVSAEGHLTAGADYNSRTGNAHIATDVRVIGVDLDGCFADYIVMPEENVWPMHPDIPDRIGAVLDPLGNAVHTVMEADVSAKSVVVTGVGVIGLMSVAVARAAGASRIFVTDVDPKRLALAKRLGANEAFDARDESWVSEVRKACRGEGADVLLEMSGARSAFEHGFAALRNGARAALLGVPSRPFEFDFNRHVIFKGVTVLGIYGRKMFETWFQMEELLLSGRLDLDAIITHEFPLEQFEKAFETMISGEGIKVVMSVN